MEIFNYVELGINSINFVKIVVGIETEFNIQYRHYGSDCDFWIVYDKIK